MTHRRKCYQLTFSHCMFLDLSTCVARYNKKHMQWSPFIHACSLDLQIIQENQGEKAWLVDMMHKCMTLVSLCAEDCCTMTCKQCASAPRKFNSCAQASVFLLWKIQKSRLGLKHLCSGASSSIHLHAWYCLRILPRQVTCACKAATPFELLQASQV